MADPEGQQRGKRSEQHEERLSRSFDEVMGLGPFADTSRGSATSSRSSGAEKTPTKEDEDSPRQGEGTQRNEERAARLFDEVIGLGSFCSASSSRRSSVGEDTPNKEGEDSSRPAQHEERVSRVFDEVMGLGPFSASSSRSSVGEDTPNKEEEDSSRPPHEERMSRSFDEVMGLGPFADTSRGSATSSRSSGVEKTPTKEDEDSPRQGEGTQRREDRAARLFDEVMGLGPFSAASSRSSGTEDTPNKEGEDSSRQGECIPRGEEDSNASGREERMDEDEGEAEHLASPSSGQHSPTAMETEGEGEGSGKTGSDGAAAKPPTVRVVEGEEDEEDEDWHFALPTVEEVVEKSRETPAENDPFATVPAEEDQEKGDSNDSANTSHSSQDGGVPIVPKPSAVTEDSQQGERSEPAPPPNPPTPPVIKDEPIDEGYDAALLPQGSLTKIKEELDNQEEESLKISNVYSVGGASSFVAPTVPAPAPAPVPVQATATHFFIPGRGTFIQTAGLPPIPIRAPVVAQNVAQNLMRTNLIPRPPPPQPPPPPPATASSVSCSGCSKVLLKGQTAFQRKGSTQLFCSTVCLTGHLPTTSKARSCYQCLKEITQAKDLVMAPIDANNYMHFCSHFCLFVFNRKRKPVAEKPVEKPAEKPEKPACSVCRITTKIEHEVTHLGRLHKLCSDACFSQWRKTRQLEKNCCDGCGLYCKSDAPSCQTLNIDKSPLNFCSPTCISTYKQTCVKMTECGNCKKMVQVSSTTMERDSKGKIQLYCTPLCVEKSRSPKHVLSGTSFPCCLCKTVAVPQYHLAMVDGTIRNFCSIDCVSVFRKTVQPSNAEIQVANGTSSAAPREPPQRASPGQGPLPGEGPPPSSVPPLPQEAPVHYPGHHPHTSVPPLVPPYSNDPLKQAEGDPSKLTCHQCRKLSDTKPLLFSYEGRISLFCSKTCCEQYKRQKNILIVCDHCKLERLLYEVTTYNQQERVFCSENCKLLFKHEQTNRNKEQSWRTCSYCSSVGHRMLHSNYSGKMEEFCKPHCMSQYTVLYYGMARCDNCRKQGYMGEKLQCSGSVRTFCGLPCLRQYCHHYFDAGLPISTNGAELPPPYAPRLPHHSSKINPVIGDVVSLASSSSSQPQATADTALSGALPPSNTHGKNIDNASTQTDAMRLPASRRRQMKNKSVLCRPVTMDQETLCEMTVPDTEPLSRESAAANPTVAPPAELASLASPGSAAPPVEPGPSPTVSGKGNVEALPARLTGRHFLAMTENSKSACKVCSNHKRTRVEQEQEEKEEEGGEEQERKRTKREVTEGGDEEQNVTGEEKAKEEGSEERKKENTVEEDRACGQARRRHTQYYCKTCPDVPSLCPVPCFELYHTQQMYTAAPELDPPGASQCSSSGGVEKVRMVMVPVPVPVFIPVPMNMYSQHTPVPLAMPMPIPVPLVLPQKKEMKDAAVQWEPLAEQEKGTERDKIVSYGDQVSTHSGEVESQAVTRLSLDSEDPLTEGSAGRADPSTAHKEESTESEDTPMTMTTPRDPLKSTQTEESQGTDDNPCSTSVDQQPPSSPMMDLESDLSPERYDLDLSAPRRGLKRQRDGSQSRKRGKRRVLDRSALSSRPKLNHLYGVKAWGSWVLKHNTQADTEPHSSRSRVVKEDILQCDSSELSYALCCFIKEVRRPNGGTYSADSIFYLCLGIQKYLFEKGRIENIFTDELYSQFSLEIANRLQHWKPQLLPSGGLMPSRVQEAYLWDCKQLGAYSPVVLLNTLLFFCTKAFRFTTPQQHQRLSFANFTRRSRPCSHRGKALYLHHRGRQGAAAADGDDDGDGDDTAMADHQDTEGDLEIPENISSPLHCPVRLYEFYMSRCPESVKKSTEFFYLQPEGSVHTNSSHWYTSKPLESSTLVSMLTRILAVMEVQHDIFGIGKT